MSTLGRDHLSVVQWDGLGDHLLAWPALRALGAASRLTLFEGPGPHFSFYRDVPIEARPQLALADTAERLVDVDASIDTPWCCDALVSLAGWANPTLLALAERLGARRTVGFFDLFGEDVPREPDRHMVDNYFAIARHMFPGVGIEDHVAPPVFSPVAERAALRLRAELVGPGERLLFVHPETSAAKMWTGEGFSATLRVFLEHRPEFKAVVVSRDPLWFDHDPKRVFFRRTHLELALALLGEGDLFLGVDSVFLHAADLLSLPGVALFGPLTRAASWGFRISERGSNLTTPSLEALSPTRVADALLEASEHFPHGRDRHGHGARAP